ncbi:hypothetical protein EAE99_004295 [Botrytis elliptica]|nr:hypothetical protein EAE99_004295 [Botrytis elliptica]
MLSFRNLDRRLSSLLMMECRSAETEPGIYPYESERHYKIYRSQALPAALGRQFSSNHTNSIVQSNNPHPPYRITQSIFVYVSWFTYPEQETVLTAISNRVGMYLYTREGIVMQEMESHIRFTYKSYQTVLLPPEKKSEIFRRDSGAKTTTNATIPSKQIENHGLEGLFLLVNS